MPQNQHVLFRS